MEGEKNIETVKVLKVQEILCNFHSIFTTSVSRKSALSLSKSKNLNFQLDFVSSSIYYFNVIQKKSSGLFERESVDLPVYTSFEYTMKIANDFSDF